MSCKTKARKVHPGIDNLNSPMSIKQTEFVIKGPFIKRKTKNVIYKQIL